VSEPRKSGPREGKKDGSKKGAAKKDAPRGAAKGAPRGPVKRVAKKTVAKRASEERAARRREESSGAARTSAGKRPSPRKAPVRHGPPPERRTPVRGAKTPVHDPNGVRLQRVLAAAGMGSRRACELLIDEGRVEVDGAVVVDQGLRVDPDKAVIHVDGLRIASAHDHVYLLLNKPVGVVSTMSDPEGRTTIADYLGGRDARLFHVGRLDADTEGLILITNDGDLAHRLSHPSFGVVKTYLAEVTGPVARDVGRRLKAGIELEDGPAKVDGFRLVDTIGSRVLVEIALHEGRKHIVRRMLAEVGHPVTRLVRTDLGPISLGNLKPGKQRKLSQQEIGALYRAVGL
jgi:23S rRNA pseudouridine2605 synthase